MENFHPGHRDGYRGQPGFSHEHIENFTKERVARRDLGDRAIQVDWALMKKP